MDCFERNLQRLTEQQPALAIELRWHGPQSGSLSTLKVSLPAVQHLVIYGVARAAYDQWLAVDKARQLYIWEPDRDRLRALISDEFGSQLLSHGRVQIVTLLPSGLQGSAALLPAEPYAATAHFTALKRQWELLREAERRNATEHDGQPFYNHFFNNLYQLPEAHLATDLWGAFEGIPAIICGAGPSLDQALPRLEQLRDRALIMAGGSALTGLTRAGINPHFGAGIDPTWNHWIRTLKSDGFAVPLFYRNRMHHEAVAMVQGPRLYVSGANGYPINAWADEQLGIPASGINEGVSVTTFLLDIAAKLGCSPLVLVGMDLTFGAGGEYASAVGASAEPLPPGAIEVEGCLTQPHWVVEAKWIGHWARGRQVFNATPNGLPIPDVPCIPLAVEGPERDLDGMVAAAVQSARHPTGDVDRVVAKLEKSFEKCEQLLTELEQQPESGAALVAELELEEEVAYCRVLAHHGH